MKTWIICADDKSAKMFLKSEIDGVAHLYQTIPLSRSRLKGSKKTKFENFIHYVVEEIEIACGFGTQTELILCAEPEILDR